MSADSNSNNNGINNNGINNGTVANPANPANPTGQNMNPYNYMDIVIGGQIASQLSRFNSKDGFTLMNIGILLTTLSLWEIKGGLTSTVTLIKENYKPFFMGIYTGIASYKASFWSRSGDPKNIFISNQIAYELAPHYKKTYTMQVINEFVECFIYFLQRKNENKTQNVTVLYDVLDDQGIVFENMEKTVITEKYDNIQIQFKDIQIRLKNQIQFAYENSVSNDSIKRSNQFKALNHETNLVQQVDQWIVDNKYKVTYLDQLIDDPCISLLFETLRNQATKQDSSLRNIVTVDVIKDMRVIDNLQVKGFVYKTTITESAMYAACNASGVNNQIPEKLVLAILKYHFPKLVLEISLNQLILLTTMIASTYHSNGRSLVPVKGIYIKDNRLYFLDLELAIPLPLLEIQHRYTYSISYPLKILDETRFCFNNTVGGHMYTTLKQYIYFTQTIFHKSLMKMQLGIRWTAGCGHYKQNVHISYLDNKYIDGAKEIDTQVPVKGFNPSLKMSSDTGTASPSGGSSNSGSSSSGSSSSGSSNAASNATKEKTFVFESVSTAAQTDELFHEFIKHIKDLSKIIHSSGNNVDIFRIQLNKTKKRETVPNPEYEEFVEKRKMLAAGGNEGGGDGEDAEESGGGKRKGRRGGLRSSFLFADEIPEKNIINETVMTDIDVKLVNHGYKSFDTLYLKKNDEKKLLSVLNKFQTKKEILKAFGLPNKCCILFDGQPGTGKSSCILTIASYLKKSIYYMSFKNIETNSDLQTVFDHVINNCNGGIIVIEDIDAIGNFLHKRDEKWANKENLQNTEDPISLAYFLNLLQGTITPDGLIFIATTNHLEVLDPAFYRDGRFDVKIAMTECDEYQLNRIYHKFINRKIPEKYIPLLLEQKITPAKFIFYIKDYMDDPEYTDSDILDGFFESLRNSVF